MKLWAKVKALFKRKQLDRDLEDELVFHLTMREAKNRERGIESEESHYAARRQFGNVMRIKEACREAWSFVSLETTWRDLRYGARALAKNPGFTVVAVLAIGLGIGMNTGIFSVLNGVALKLLPVPRAEQIVSVDQIFHGKAQRNEHGEPGLFSYAEYKNYRANNHVFSGLLAYAPFLGGVPLEGENPKGLMGAETSCNFFDVLGERPSLGRTFVEADCRAPGGSPVVVLSDDLWRSQFGAESLIVGQSISLNRTKFVVIGVAAPGFRGLDPWPIEFWAPVTMQKALEPDSDLLLADTTGWLALQGRMRPGVSLEEVRADLGVIAGRIDQLHPGRTTTLAIHRASEGLRPAEGDCYPACNRGKPVADRPATANGEPADCVSWWVAGVAAGGLVARGHCAVCAGALADTRGFAALVEFQSRPARLGVFAGAHSINGNCVWTGAGVVCNAAGPEHRH
ncbi:MAG: hypothetical protein DMG37_16990 [Acidobacteria bacterium]|nr:MAG: hypothetical protein DMG37_16990 [Acidobacteriota bacterium]